MLRTKTCGELKKSDDKKTVTLCGWVQSRRDHGGIIFIDLRDRYGLTQVVFDPKHNKEIHKLAEHLGREFVLQVTGKVRPRKQGMINKKLKTGEIEVITDEFIILSKSETPPMEIENEIKTNEDFRLKYRYLDLRRPVMQKNILTRHQIVKVVRDFYDNENFIEIETPDLARSTPEGARDYLVPSRVNPGKFFALPQSPQQFKQLLMVSGFDKYFQIVKCFRDEDLRADRQPEFSQIDVEMSFITEEDIYDLNDRLFKDIWKKILKTDIKIPFPRLTYKEAMDKYGSDKPDVRFGLELIDVSELVKNSDFNVFKQAVESNGKVKCINAKNCAKFSRNEIDELTNVVSIYDAKGLAWMKLNDELEGSIVKFFKPELQKKLIETTKAKKGDLLLFVADHKHRIVETSLGHLRLHLGKKLNLIDESLWSFVWITEFPLVEFDEDEQRHVAVHHPFTSPMEEDLKFINDNPEKVRAKCYDLTLNGWELGSGSIRIHDKDLQEKMFNALKISQKEQMNKFGHLLTAFRYGAPPHGGIAFGLDRLVALITKSDNIREVIAFPKNKFCKSLMDEAPNEIDEKQLKELNLRLDLPKK